jgi:hypothetical protein
MWISVPRMYLEVAMLVARMPSMFIVRALLWLRGEMGRREGEGDGEGESEGE